MEEVADDRGLVPQSFGNSQRLGGVLARCVVLGALNERGRKNAVRMRDLGLEPGMPASARAQYARSKAGSRSPIRKWMTASQRNAEESPGPSAKFLSCSTASSAWVRASE